LNYAIDGRYIQDHFPGIGRYTYNLIDALARSAPTDRFVVLCNPSLRNSRWFFRWAAWLAAKTSARVIVPSHATRDDLIAHLRVPREKIVVIPLAADARLAPQSAAEIARVREKYALPERFVLYVGINKPHKNLATLLDAWARVERDAMLVVAGAWDARYAHTTADRRPMTDVQSLAVGGHRSAVKFIRDVDDADLAALYVGATVFVMPSLYEGFGLPPLEAMASGAPVICSNASSLPEVVGDAALLVNPRDAEDIARAITHVLDDAALRDELRAKSLARAAQFSWERTAEMTLAVYREITA
jgi:alpha-1,3-rhamnosyl/mannosyltransferase